MNHYIITTTLKYHVFAESKEDIMNAVMQQAIDPTDTEDIVGDIVLIGKNINPDSFEEGYATVLIKEEQ